MKIYGLFARTARFVYKIFGGYKAEVKSPLPEPSVFVVHHQNLFGPIHAILTLPMHAHLWVYSVFFEKESCYRQYADYTFTKRLNMKPYFAYPLAWLLSYLFPFALRSFKAIPVYRGTRDIVKTLSQSLSALTSGESVIISPDVDYSDSSGSMGDIYTGFLHLEKKYFSKTGKHLSFVPVSFDKQRRRTVFGESVAFDDTSSFLNQKNSVAKKLQNQINSLHIDNKGL